MKLNELDLDLLEGIYSGKIKGAPINLVYDLYLNPAATRLQSLATQGMILLVHTDQDQTIILGITEKGIKALDK